MPEARVEPGGETAGRRSVRVALGIAVPLAVVALAYALWWISDRLLYIGPLDRASFGWAVVIPVWVAAPVAAGFAWRRLGPRESLVAANVVGAGVSGAATLMFWQAVAHPNCAYGAVRTPGEWALPAVALGLSVGAGLGASCLLAAWYARAGRRWSAVVAGAGAEIVMVFAAILVAGMLLMGPGCQRPPL